MAKRLIGEKGPVSRVRWEGSELRLE
jgi:hypothetical protein